MGKTSKTSELIFKAAEEFSPDYHKVTDRARNEHNRICKNIVRLHKEHNFPISLLLYLAVGTSAHKLKVMEQGYKKLDTKKALQVIEYCNILDEKLNAKQEVKTNYRTNEIIVHAMSRYYELTCADGKKLRRALTNEIVNNIRKKIKGRPSSREVYNLLISTKEDGNE